MNIVAAGNTYNPCLIALRDKGYRVWVEEGEETVVWCAERNGNTFAAYSPPELLGLATMGEQLGEEWNRQEPDLISQVLGHPL